MDNKLIKVVNTIQEILLKYNLKKEIDLPELVVVGSQSVGKSSLLEKLIGESFLPKGEGIVTRSPILIQCYHDKNIKNTEITFSHLENTKFTDFQQVGLEIIKKTKEIAGDSKDISSEPIILKIKGEKFYTMSFIDLPGLTKIPIKGQ